MEENIININLKDPAWLEKILVTLVKGKNQQEEKLSNKQLIHRIVGVADQINIDCDIIQYCHTSLDDIEEQKRWAKGALDYAKELIQCAAQLANQTGMTREEILSNV